MKKASLFLFFTISSILSYAQDFLIKHNGDTLRGNIVFSGKLFAVSQPTGIDSIYSADDIRYINIRNHKGIVFHCNLIIYSDNIDIVQKWNYNGGREVDTVMILHEIFSTPKMTLFEAPDKDRSMYYFVKKPTDHLPVQMMVHYFINVRTDYIVSVLTQLRIYADQLRVMMADCPKVTEADLEMMDYRSYSFKKIIRQYNKCK